DFRVGERDLIENQRDLLAGIQACGKLQSLAQSKFKPVGIIADVLLAPEREVVEGRLPRHYLVPGDPAHDLAHLSGIVSGGVNPPDQTAHAGACDVIRSEVMFLEPGNDTDVGEPERPAALENQAD